MRLALAALVALVAYGVLCASLAELDGQSTLASLDAAVQVQRDAQGVPTITATSRLDLARATGYVHGQERFFQMDLMRLVSFPNCLVAPPWRMTSGGACMV